MNIIIFFGTVTFSFFSYSYQAITRVPVADLVGESQGVFHRTSNNEEWYKNLPLCTTNKNHCLRIHQLLLHEQVTIVEEKNDEVKIEIPQLFYQTAQSAERQNTYWSLKKNFVPLSALSNAEQQLVPPVISWKKPATLSPSCITLLYPYTDPKTKRTFSAGTRFMVHSHTKDHYAVACLDEKKVKMTRLFIPSRYCLQTNCGQSKIDTFVTILHKWAHHHSGCIPYVWGGCSIVNFCTHPFSVKTDKDYTYYVRPETQYPQTGMDCTGLVARAAQMAGLPYYFKNSTTVEKQLQRITQANTIKNGDIIWFSGHIIVINDIQKNTIIEARAYDHGFGKIHELALSAVFQNIKNVHDLFEAYIKKKPLQRLDAQGKVAQTIAHFKLLKMPTG